MRRQADAQARFAARIEPVLAKQVAGGRAHVVVQASAERDADGRLRVEQLLPEQPVLPGAQPVRLAAQAQERVAPHRHPEAAEADPAGQLRGLFVARQAGEQRRVLVLDGRDATLEFVADHRLVQAADGLDARIGLERPGHLLDPPTVDDVAEIEEQQHVAGAMPRALVAGRTRQHARAHQQPHRHPGLRVLVQLRVGRVGGAAIDDDDFVGLARRCPDRLHRRSDRRLLVERRHQQRHAQGFRLDDRHLYPQQTRAV